MNTARLIRFKLRPKQQCAIIKIETAKQ